MTRIGLLLLLVTVVAAPAQGWAQGARRPAPQAAANEAPVTAPGDRLSDFAFDGQDPGAVLEDLDAFVADPIPDPVEPAEVAAPSKTAAPPPEPTGPVIPEGWVEYSRAGYHFAVPPDWKVIEGEDDDEKIVVGDMNMAKRTMLGVMVDRQPIRVLDEMSLSDPKDLKDFGKPFGVDLSAATPQVIDFPAQELPGGRILSRKTIRIAHEGFFGFTDVHHYPDPDSPTRNWLFTLAVMAVNLPEDQAMPVLERVAKTVSVDAPAPVEAETHKGLAGLMHYDTPLPEGWRRLSNSPDFLSFSTTPITSAWVVFMTGHRVETLVAGDMGFAGAPTSAPATILGHSASRLSGTASKPEVQVGASMVQARRTVFILDQCLANGDRIAVDMNAAPPWLKDGPGFAPLLRALTLELPQDAGPCGASKTPPPASLHWDSYGNARFGTRLRYPPDLFQPTDFAPANDDGRQFQATDGGQSGFVVWAVYDVLEQSMEDIAREFLTSHPADEVLFDQRQADALNLGLRMGDWVFLRRTLRVDGVLHNVELRYPHAQDDRYGAAAKQIVASLAAPDSPGASAPATAAPPATAPAPGTQSEGAMELAFWNSVQDSGDAAMLQAYLDRWPNGTFAVLARLKLQGLGSASPPQPETPSAPRSGPQNPGFEDGTLAGWTATGTAFAHQPTLGDNPSARGRGQPANHQGRYWIGTFEAYQGKAGQTAGSTQGDGPTGTLTSTAFTLPAGQLSFSIGGGMALETRVELLVGGVRVLHASGKNSETMERVRWDITPWAGQSGQLRIVDNASGSWGHINVDDFRLERSGSTAPASPGPAIIAPGPGAGPAIVAPTSPPSTQRGYYTPPKGSAERQAIMDAARAPMFNELGQRVLFLVETLRTDGQWAYLGAEPLQANGQKLNWSATRYANDWALDAMSDLVMVLLRNQGGGWQVVDYVIGPTDVHWYNWVDGYGLPEQLFTPGY